MRHRTTAAVALPTALLLLAGCSGSEDPAATSDPDRVVLAPAEEGAGHTHAPGETDARPIGDGTSPSAGGYRLDAVSMPGRGAGTREVTFRIIGPDGPVTDYVEEQTKLLHMYVVRRDLQEFRHLHPTLGDDGTWTTRVDLGAPGPYRVLAEFQPAGADRPVELGAEVEVDGDWTPVEVPAPDVAATADDGLVRVAVDGTGEVGDDGRLRLLVSDLEGRPLQLGTYLGATAHVSGFRVQDGSFVHVHPYGSPEQTDDGTRLTFHTAFDRPGQYRFFVQVRVEGFVHTVPVTALVG